MKSLRAGALLLEPQTRCHAAEMFRVLSDPAIYEFENAPPESVRWLEDRFGRLESRSSADGSEQWLNWVVRVPTGELAGYVQATVMTQGLAYVAYEFASKFWRQGVGRSSVNAVLEELSAGYSVRSAVAVLKARNFRSLALLRNLGFAPDPAPGLASINCQADERVMYKPLGPGENVT